MLNNIIGMEFKTLRGFVYRIVWNGLDNEYMFLNLDSSIIISRCSKKEIEETIKQITKKY